MNTEERAAYWYDACAELQAERDTYRKALEEAMDRLIDPRVTDSEAMFGALRTIRNALESRVSRGG